MATDGCEAHEIRKRQTVRNRLQSRTNDDKQITEVIRVANDTDTRGRQRPTEQELARKAIRRLEYEREGYLNQAQECSDAIRKVRAEYGLEPGQ